MTVTSDPSSQAPSPATAPPTSSPASAAGRSPSSLLVGLPLDLFGQPLVPASPSRAQAADAARRMNAIYGLFSCATSRSLGLQRSLESRLRAALDVHGSPEFELTWKAWAIESGPPICALRASARRTSASDSSGWPTPDACAMNDCESLETWKARRERLLAKGYNGNGFGRPLAIEAQLHGWATPTMTDGKSSGSRMTPGSQAHPGESLTDQALGCSTGRTPSGESGEAAKPGALNPALSLWLQGFPAAWASFAPQGTASSRRSRPSSSAPSSTP